MRKVIERGRLHIRFVSAGKYIVEKRTRNRNVYAGLISRIRPKIDSAATCWQISGPLVGITRYGFRTLDDAIHGFELEAR